jgi:hypothetical protein
MRAGDMPTDKDGRPMLKVPVNGFDGPRRPSNDTGQAVTTDWMKAVMDIRKINRGLSVSPQIAPADMAEFEDGGFSFDHLQPPRRRRQ